MPDRLTIINDALIATGNEPLNVEYDGSDEWIAADSAYRRALSYLLSKHRWSFATKTAPLASRLLETPSGYERYESAFALPGDLLHLSGAFYGGVPFTDYEIVDQKFCTWPKSGVTIEYVRAPNEGQWPAGFVELLTMKVEAHLYRSPNEDTANADKRDMRVDAELAELRALSDQQDGRRAILRSRTAQRRRGAIGYSSRYPYAN